MTLTSVGSACRAAEYTASVSACESTLSATTTRTRLEASAHEAEQPLVVLLLRVEKDDVEGLVERLERRERVAFVELRPLFETGLGHVPPPSGAFLRILLERDHSPAEDPYPGREPDRRVATRATEFEHLAAGVGATSEKRKRPVVGAT